MDEPGLAFFNSWHTAHVLQDRMRDKRRTPDGRLRPITLRGGIPDVTTHRILSQEHKKITPTIIASWIAVAGPVHSFAGMAKCGSVSKAEA
mmetsp:Transcript_144531/g.402722  ORF Transcript_144531/g.402722 Transcript_144531/m.402722 type:complete len:91 (+) Transcript_144531:1167-1439(+)